MDSFLLSDLTPFIRSDLTPFTTSDSAGLSYDAQDAYAFGDDSTIPIDFDHPGGVWSTYCVVA